jgi:hypothetical protein
MTAQALWMNIPLMVLAFALWVGVPLWIVHRHPDRHPRETRNVPACGRRGRSGPPRSGPGRMTASVAWWPCREIP